MHMELFVALLHFTVSDFYKINQGIDKKVVMNQLDIGSINDIDKRFLFESPKITSYGHFSSKSQSPARKIKISTLSTKHALEINKSQKLLSINQPSNKMSSPTVTNINQASLENLDRLLIHGDNVISPPMSRANSKGKSNSVIQKCQYLDFPQKLRFTVRNNTETGQDYSISKKKTSDAVFSPKLEINKKERLNRMVESYMTKNMIKPNPPGLATTEETLEEQENVYQLAPPKANPQPLQWSDLVLASLLICLTSRNFLLGLKLY